MSNKLYIKVKGTAAYAWLDRPSPKYGNFEVTLRDVANRDEIEKQIDALIEEQLPKAQIAKCRKAPFGKLKDEDETPTIKGRSKYAPDVYNAKGQKLKHSPSVGQGSKLIAEIAFEVKVGDKGPGVIAYLQSVQIIKLVEGKRSASFEDVSGEEDAYVGEGAEEAAYVPGDDSSTESEAEGEAEEAPKDGAKKLDAKKRKATDF